MKVCQRSHEIDDADFAPAARAWSDDEDIWDIAAITAFLVVQPHGVLQRHDAQ